MSKKLETGDKVYYKHRYGSIYTVKQVEKTTKTLAILTGGERIKRDPNAWNDYDSYPKRNNWGAVDWRLLTPEIEQEIEKQKLLDKAMQWLIRYS